MLTPKKPWRLRIGQDEDSRLMLTMRVGGSIDSDDTDVTVMPVMSLPRPAVITLTAPTRWRIAPRKSSGDASGASSMVQASTMGSSTFVLTVYRYLPVR